MFPQLDNIGYHGHSSWLRVLLKKTSLPNKLGTHNKVNDGSKLPSYCNPTLTLPVPPPNLCKSLISHVPASSNVFNSS